MRYFIETYGCQMNKAESAALKTQFDERGWAEAGDAESADLVLINTCSVRISAENRAWGRIAHHAARKREKDFFLVVTGCMAERLKDAMRRKIPAIDYVLGNFQKQAFGLVLDAAARGERLPAVEETPSFVFASSHWEPGAFRAFVPIMHGCDNFCSYCIVPYVRGRETSRDPEAVLREVAALAARGVREITLLGQNVNSYRYGEGSAELGFPGLLERVASEARAGGIGKIRFVTSHPKDFSERTMDVLAGDTIFSRHIHLCAQHGSDRILEAMNRKYTRRYYTDLAARIRERIPDASLSTDILVGFPGETEEDLEQALSLMEEVRFAYAYMYHFNPREGTPAVGLPDRVPEGVKRERLARVIALQKRISGEIMRSMLGREIEVLVEGVSKKKDGELLGRSDHDMMVVFPGEAARIGNFVRVGLASLRGNTFRAQEVP